MNAFRVEIKIGGVRMLRIGDRGLLSKLNLAENVPKLNFNLCLWLWQTRFSETREPCWEVVEFWLAFFEDGTKVMVKRDPTVACSFHL